MPEAPLGWQTSGMTSGYRVEKDTLGEVRVPADALWGAQTQRAVENFPVSGRRLPRRLIRAMALIKKAAAEVNRERQALPPELAEPSSRRPRRSRTANTTTSSVSTSSRPAAAPRPT